MRRLLSSSEVVDTVVIDGNLWEIYATGEAEYDDMSSQLAMRLDVGLRSTNGKFGEHPSRPKWLPFPTTQAEHVVYEEARDVAKEIFGSWVRRIQRGIPNSNNPSPV